MFIKIIVFVLLVVFMIFCNYWMNIDNFTNTNLNHNILINPYSFTNPLINKKYPNKNSFTQSSVLVSSYNSATNTKPHIYMKSDTKINSNGKEKKYSWKYDSLTDKQIIYN